MGTCILTLGLSFSGLAQETRVLLGAHGLLSTSMITKQLPGALIIFSRIAELWRDEGRSIRFTLVGFERSAELLTMWEYLFGNFRATDFGVSESETLLQTQSSRWMTSKMYHPPWASCDSSPNVTLLFRQVIGMWVSVEVGPEVEVDDGPASMEHGPHMA